MTPLLPRIGYMWAGVMVLACLCTPLGVYSSDSATVIGAGASLPAQLYDRASYLYRLDTGVSVEYSPSGSSAGRGELAAGSVDFAAADNVREGTVGEDVVLLPTVAAAVVCMYNVDNVGGPAGSTTASSISTPQPAIVLDAATLAGIFVGSISRWDDARVKALNPTLQLPAANITVVVRNDTSGTTSIFTTALSRLNATFSGLVGNSSRAVWPIPSHRLVQATKSIGVTSAVSTTPNSIGYNVLEQALSAAVPYASFKYDTGQVVTAGTHALIERVVRFSPNGFGAIVNEDLAPHSSRDLVDSPSSWPIAGYSYLLLRKSFIRPGTNCSHRVATHSFWEWFLSSTTASSLAAELGFATIPAFVNQQVLELMATAFTCKVSTSSGGGASEVIVSGYGNTIFSGAAAFISLAYQMQHTEQAMTFVPTSVAGAPPLFSANASWALHIKGMTYGWLPTAPAVIGAGTLQEVTTVPAAAVGLVLLFNLPWWPAGTPLILSEDVLGDILSGTITRWDNILIRADNPHVAASTWQAATIVPIVRSDSCAENFIVSDRLVDESSAFRLAMGGDAPFTTWPSAKLPPGAVLAGSNTYAAALLHTTPNSLAYVSSVHDVINAEGINVAQMKVLTPNADGSYAAHVIAYSEAAQSACTAGSTVANAALPHDASCWPLTGVVLVSFPSAFTEDAVALQQNPGRSCRTGKVAARFVQWLVSTQTQRALADFGVAELLPSVDAVVTASLNESITCDGNSILNPGLPCSMDDVAYTQSECDPSTVKYEISFHWKSPKHCVGGIALPGPIKEACEFVPWGSKTSIVSSVAVGVCALSIALLLVWMLRNRDLQLVRLMQPSFCFGFLSAAFISLLCIATLNGPNTTPYCVARVWAVNLPFTIMFATLLARMYRVWRLFAVKSAAFKSTVVRNKDLLRLVLLSAGVMGVLLTLWTLVGGIRSVTGVKTITIGVNIPWTTCESDVAAFSVAAAVLQGMLILLGVFLSVQSWHVEESVAEARPMAIAIYNIALIAGIVFLMVISFASEPAARVALTEFGLIWAVEVSACAVFAKRLWQYFKDPAAATVVVTRKSPNKARRRSSTRGSSGMRRQSSIRSGRSGGSAHSSPASRSSRPPHATRGEASASSLGGSPHSSRTAAGGGANHGDGGGGAAVAVAGMHQAGGQSGHAFRPAAAPPPPPPSNSGRRSRVDAAHGGGNSAGNAGGDGGGAVLATKQSPTTTRTPGGGVSVINPLDGGVRY